MNIDYEKLGEVSHKAWERADAVMDGNVEYNQVWAEVARAVITASGLLEEVERLQAKVRRVEEVEARWGNELDLMRKDPMSFKDHYDAEICRHEAMLKELTAALKGEI